jgi:outer membrane protein OmpU
MGIVSDELRSELNPLLSDTFFSSRIRISFTASGETDNGLSFGGAIRADNAGGGAGGTAGNVFVRGAFGTLSMGDVSSAAEKATGDLAEVGYTGGSAYGATSFLSAGDITNLTNNLGVSPSALGGFGNEMLYLTGIDTPVLLYSYSIDSFGLFASVGQPGDDNTTWSVGATYAADGFSFGIGYEDMEDVGNHLIVSAGATLGDVALKAIYGTADFDDVAEDLVQYGLSATYTAGALRTDAFWRTTDVVGEFDVRSAGIGATYSLGGGAAIEGGISRLDVDGETFNRVDLGMTFRF